MTDRPDRPDLGPEFEQPSQPDSPSGSSPTNWQPGPVYGTPGTGPGYEQASAPPPAYQPPVYQPSEPQFQAYQQPQYQPQSQYAAGYPAYVQLSDKSKSAAGLLELLPSFVGICGVGRLYLGHTATGLIQLLGMLLASVLAILLIGIPFMVAIWIWNLVDAIQMFSGNVADSQGRPLRD